MDKQERQEQYVQIRSNAGGVYAFSIFVMVVFSVLNYLGVVEISWWLVLIPFYFPVVTGCLFIILSVVLAFVGTLKRK